MSNWYYKVGGEVVGPVNTNAIMKLISNNDLLPESLVWTKSMKQWSPLKNIDVFHKSVSDSPLNIPTTECIENRQEEIKRSGDGAGFNKDIGEKSTELPLGYLDTPRPWVRFWARIFDYHIFTILLMFLFMIIYALLLYFFYPSLLPSDDWQGSWLANIFLYVALRGIWVFIEAFLLSTWGTTLGKWLLGISVRNASGSKLSYSDALNRSLQVWVKGLWLGVPLFNLFGLISSYDQLKGEMKRTSWDLYGGYVVRHKKLNFFGVVIVAIVLLVSFYLNYLIN